MSLFLKGKLALATVLLTAQNLFAQQPVTDGVEMADRLRADGKIWVVVAVIALVFAGIIVYLIQLDRKIGKLENEVKDKHQPLNVRP
ncbi:CcmD family protein [Fibrisoma montanum]|uniref:CcmD family protein n=1 Tax=Fibrisoma montanum TaxID=2305895 RepID=A0A418MDJ3_9BACT|nr:CcmD family protein [Fibrisoma montanum]RIV24852.1 CcmD family protein [Fibrisoma montanum]